MKSLSKTQKSKKRKTRKRGCHTRNKLKRCQLGGDDNDQLIIDDVNDVNDIKHNILNIIKYINAIYNDNNNNEEKNTLLFIYLNLFVLYDMVNNYTNRHTKYKDLYTEIKQIYNYLTLTSQKIIDLNNYKAKNQNYIIN